MQIIQTNYNFILKYTFETIYIWYMNIFLTKYYTVSYIILDRLGEAERRWIMKNKNRQWIYCDIEERLRRHPNSWILSSLCSRSRCEFSFDVSQKLYIELKVHVLMPGHHQYLQIGWWRQAWLMTSISTFCHMTSVSVRFFKRTTHPPHIATMFIPSFNLSRGRQLSFETTYS